MKVTLERLDTKNSQAKYNLDIPENGLELGRGPLLKIDATNISRKKAILSVKNGCLYMKCVKNPGVIIDHDATTGTEQVVEVSHGDVELVDGDVLKFDANQFFFKVSYVPEKCDMKNENRNLLIFTYQRGTLGYLNTSPQSFILAFSYSLAYQHWGININLSAIIFSL